MTGRTTIQGTCLGILCLVSVACAGNTPAPDTPASSDEPRSAPTDLASEPGSSGQSLDVGMEFKDKNEDSPRRASHDAPPTASWKPVDKEKAADPKKPTATAAR